MSEYIYKRERIADGIYSAESTGEEIVRCRDCSWFCEGSEVFVTYDWCRNFDCETNEDGYCAWGVKREEGGE